MRYILTYKKFDHITREWICETKEVDNSSDLLDFINDAYINPAIEIIKFTNTRANINFNFN